MAGTINLTRKYTSKTKNIPFTLQNNVHRVRFVDNSLERTAETSVNLSLEYYITYFFPEYYRIMKDNISDDSYDDLRRILASFITVENAGYTEGPSDNVIVVTKMSVVDTTDTVQGNEISFSSINELRNRLEDLGIMPDFVSSLDYFNAEQEIAGRPGQEPNNLTADSQFDLLSIANTSKDFEDVMKELADEKLSFANTPDSPVNLSGVDFDFLTIEVRKVINIVISEVIESLEINNNDFVEGDTITFFFSNKGQADPLEIFVKNGIAAILVSTAVAGTDYLKIGYLSNIKYRTIFHDQLLLSTLKNYQNILDAGLNSQQPTGRPFGVADFIQETLPQDTLNRLQNNNLFVFDTENPNATNPLLQEAQRLGLIDLDDNEDLKKGIKALTQTEKAKLKQEIANNPELAEKIYQQQKRRKLETGINIAETISQIAETGLPFAEGSALDQLLSQLGIKALAREALICLTFGLNLSVARIADAVAAVLEEEVNERPPMELNFDLFTIKGDIEKQILNIILSSVQQAIFALISGLADLLAELCDIDNPRRDDYGDTDLGDLIKDNLTGIDPNLLSENGPLENLSDLVGGMNSDEIFDYLSDLSDVLSSLDICQLMLNRQDVSQEVIDRIIEYNQNHPDPRIRENLTEPSQIMEFFALLSQLADVTDFCNQIANEILLLNPDICECLDAETLADLNPDEAQNLEDLLDIIENGLDEQPPLFSFDCPDSPNYIEDPVIKKLIPETFSTLLELVEMQFIQSADSVKQALLDHRLVAASGNPAFNSAQALEIDPETGEPYDPPNSGPAGENTPGSYPELPKPDKAAIGAVKTVIEGMLPVLNEISGAFNNPNPESVEASTADLLQSFQTCVIDQPNLLHPTIRDIGTTIEVLLEILSDQGVADALSGMSDQLSDIEAAAGIAGPLMPSYQFKRQYITRFDNYINALSGSRSGPGLTTVTVNNNFGSDKIDDMRRIDFYFARTSGDDISDRDVIRLKYRDNPADNTSTNQVGLRLDKLFNAGVDAATTVAQENVLRDEIVSKLDSNTEVNFNLDITKFADSFTDDNAFLNLVTGAAFNNPPSLNTRKDRYFPLSYAAIVDQVFDYYRQNGIFDAATLLSLNFFHDNINCAEDEISDLLDVNGIFKQLQKEYLEAACSGEDSPARNRMNDVLRLGMFLLLIQVHIAEFIIKNIFVLAAVDLTDVFSSSFMVSYFRDQIDTYINRFFGDLEEVFGGLGASSAAQGEELVQEIKQALVDIFNKKINRSSVIRQGGIIDEKGEVVFEEGTEFVLNKSPEDSSNIKDFNDILGFLITVRIQYSMGVIAGETETPSPVSNAVKNALPASNQKTLDEIFLSSMPVYDFKSFIPENYVDPSLADSDGEDQPTDSFVIINDEDNDIDIFDGRMENLTEITGKSKFIIQRRAHTIGPSRHVQYSFWSFLTDAGVGSAFRFNRGVKLFDVTSPPISAQDYAAWNVQNLSAVRSGPVNLTSEERKFLLQNDVYLDYFTNVFNKDIITMLPIFQNFYLASRYLSEIEEAFFTTKYQVVDILAKLVENRDDYSSEPRLERSAARNMILGLNAPNPDTLARDFILKMLIKTPIDILKGLMEMIDPHVVITKIIKRATGQAFNVMLDAASNVDLPSPGDNLPPGTPTPFDDSASAENLILALFCFLNYYVENASDLPQPPPPLPPPPGLEAAPPPRFFPRISADGVDLTGTGLGMLMIPPTPFGLIYFLLSLIKFDTQQPNIDIDIAGGDSQNTDNTGGVSECD